MVEVLLTIAMLVVIIAFTFPDFGRELQRRSLVESADRLRSLVVMAQAESMRSGLKYRIHFPRTPDPLDRHADEEIDVPIVTEQPIITRQLDPLNNPDAFGDFDAGWKNQAILQNGTRCVSLRPGRPSFEITAQSPIAGFSITEGQAVFVPLTFNPDGTCNWVNMVITDLPYQIELEPDHVTRILNVIVDGRTGQTWIQRALRVEEVEVMEKKGASPIMHMDFTSGNLITEDNILEIHVGQKGASGGRTDRANP